MALTINVTREYISLHAELVNATKFARATWNVACGEAGIPITSKFVVFGEDAENRINQANTRLLKARRAMGEYLGNLHADDIAQNS